MGSNSNIIINNNKGELIKNENKKNNNHDHHNDDTDDNCYNDDDCDCEPIVTCLNECVFLNTTTTYNLLQAANVYGLGGGGGGGSSLIDDTVDKTRSSGGGGVGGVMSSGCLPKGTVINNIMIGAGGLSPSPSQRSALVGGSTSFTYTDAMTTEIVTASGGFSWVLLSFGSDGPGNNAFLNAGDGGWGGVADINRSAFFAPINGNNNTNICDNSIDRGGNAGNSNLPSGFVGGGGGGASIIANGADGGDGPSGSVGMNCASGSGAGGGGGANNGNSGSITSVISDGGTGGSGNVIVKYGTCGCD